jgi:hypothetical protein
VAGFHEHSNESVVTVSINDKEFLDKLLHKVS